jgi:xylulokinase
MIWIRENEPDIFRKTFKFLDVKSFLIARSTGSYVTSPDEANLTWLCDTRGGVAKWSRDLVRKYGLREELLPSIGNSIDVAGKLRGEAASDLGIEAGVPVFIGAGDLTTAAVGSGAVEPGEIHVYIGTSDWVAAHLNRRRVDVLHYVGSILSAIPGRYLLVAEQEVAAGSLEWAMGIMGIEDYGVVDEMISSVEPGSGGLLFMPWMYGERAPIDDPGARGGLINLTLRHGRAELLRAIMEGVALNIRWVYPYVERIAGYNEEVRIIGGGSLFNSWCQIIADALGRRVRRMGNPRVAGLRGAAAIAAVGLGRYGDFREATLKFPVDRVFEPNPASVRIYEVHFRKLKRAYGSLRSLRH